jgi:hypothetical protein
MCVSGLPAVWEPVILLWPAGYPKNAYQPASITLGLHVCENCKNISKARHYLSPDLRQKILLGFHEQGKWLPDFKTADIVFTLADSFKNDGVLI